MRLELLSFEEPVLRMETDTDIPDQVNRSPAIMVRVHFFAGGPVNLFQVFFRDKRFNVAEKLGRLKAGRAS